MENFFQTHTYLIEHTNVQVRRALLDNIDWSYRMIAIKGPRGVGRTSFLLQYAKENFDVRLRQCLYININSFYFQGRGIVDFAGEFVRGGGLVLLIDQAFKLPDWRNQLLECYKRYPRLRIVYTTTSVPDPIDDDELAHLTRSYVLHGFSFREYINLQTGNDFQAYTLDELLTNHKQIIKQILLKVRPWQYFQEYLHHGYYPFFLENHNFTEALLKAMNMMIEVDVLFTKQIELKYLSRLKKLLYLLAVSDEPTLNVSRLAEEIGTSRATVMNYLQYLEEARLINRVYKEGEEPGGKPAAVMLHDTNLLYAVYTPDMDEQLIMETFFVNTLWRHHQVRKNRRAGVFQVNGSTEICVCDRTKRVKAGSTLIYAKYNTELGHDGEIPLWLFGFLY
ncbi:MAG: AAA family ATPase [Alloprevotella sp.]